MGPMLANPYNVSLKLCAGKGGPPYQGGGPLIRAGNGVGNAHLVMGTERHCRLVQLTRHCLAALRPMHVASRKDEPNKEV